MIHRDLKPGNLLVTEIDGRPAPKVIDFGIAKAVALGQQPSRAHTMHRAPHRHAGVHESRSRRSSRRSMSIRAPTSTRSASCCTSCSPARCRSRPRDPNATPATLVQELLTHDPAAPSARIRVACTEPQQSATNRGLTRDSSLRDSRAISTGSCSRRWRRIAIAVTARPPSSPPISVATWPIEPVVAGPPSTLYRMRKFAARHRLPLTLAAGVFVAAIVFGAMMAWQAHQLALQRTRRVSRRSVPKRRASS